MRARAASLLLAGLALAATPALAETIVITGATIHTLGSQGAIKNGTVVIENGRIKAVGANVATPAGARTIDGRGKVVTPGLFDSLSRIGLPFQLAPLFLPEAPAKVLGQERRHTRHAVRARGCNFQLRHQQLAQLAPALGLGRCRLSARDLTRGLSEAREQRGVSLIIINFVFKNCI